MSIWTMSGGSRPNRRYSVQVAMEVMQEYEKPPLQVAMEVMI